MNTGIRKFASAPMRSLFRLGLLAVLAGETLCACSTMDLRTPPAPGSTLESLLQSAGPATAVYALADGTHRYEFAHGPLGKTTYMADFDEHRSLLRWAQVLSESHFDQISAGMRQQAVRTLLGTPSRIWAVRYHDQTVWSYRYESPFCRMFHVGFTPDGTVDDTSYGPDPVCDRKGKIG